MAYPLFNRGNNITVLHKKGVMNKLKGIRFVKRFIRGGDGFRMEKWKWCLYLTALLLIGIPITIVLLSDAITFSSSFSNTVTSTAIILFIFGKMITVHKKRKENKSYASDIGIIIGISIVLVARVLV